MTSGFCGNAGDALTKINKFQFHRENHWTLHSSPLCNGVNSFHLMHPISWVQKATQMHGGKCPASSWISTGFSVQGSDEWPFPPNAISVSLPGEMAHLFFKNMNERLARFELCHSNQKKECLPLNLESLSHLELYFLRLITQHSLWRGLTTPWSEVALGSRCGCHSLVAEMAHWTRRQPSSGMGRTDACTGTKALHNFIDHGKIPGVLAVLGAVAFAFAGLIFCLKCTSISLAIASPSHIHES